MNKRILIAFDKFKDCLSGGELCNLTKSIILNNSPKNANIECICLPLADGGDGFYDCLKDFFLTGKQSTLKGKYEYLREYKFQHVDMKATSPLGSTIDTSYGLLKDDSSTQRGKIGILEMARIEGLQLVPVHMRNPYKITSRGVGEVIRHAYENGADQIWMGAGGSATVDFGIGALHELGVDILEEKDGKRIPVSRNRTLFARDIPKLYINYKWPKSPPLPLKIIIASDVTNPLLGDLGAAATFGPQKGASPKDVKKLESYMTTIWMYQILQASTGAGGGIVAGLYATMDCELHFGIDLVSDLLNLPQLVQNSDVIITGEGSFDSQSFDGKVLSKVIELGERYEKPVNIICGRSLVTKDELENAKYNVFDFASQFNMDTCFNNPHLCLNTIIKDNYPKIIGQDSNKYI